MPFTHFGGLAALVMIMALLADLVVTPAPISLVKFDENAGNAGAPFPSA